MREANKLQYKTKEMLVVYSSLKTHAAKWSNQQHSQLKQSKCLMKAYMKEGTVYRWKLWYNITDPSKQLLFVQFKKNIAAAFELKDDKIF